jgi:lysyl-tRNA synthetase, class I
MFWADEVVDETIRRYRKNIDSGVKLVVRDEKTASGRVHVGSLRSASLHALVYEGLKEKGIDATFLFEINDMDPMDGLPTYLDPATYSKEMGKPLCTIPAPDGSSQNFAEYYGNEYVGVMRDIGFTPTVYTASTLYRSGRMNNLIIQAIERRDIVRTIYKEESGSTKPEGWFPLNVICEHCGKLSTTIITAWDGHLVSYECRERAVSWTTGCGHHSNISPLNGNAKLQWKVDWAAKFVANGVHFEGGGKDHYTKGGSRQVANRITRDVFKYEPPYGIANEFFLVGGAKMSSSKGAGASAREIADLIPPHLLRLLLIKSDIGRQINIDPEGDAIPLLFDYYDTIAQKYWTAERQGTSPGSEGDGSHHDDDTRVFQKAHLPGDISMLEERFLPRFSQIAFLIQMPHLVLLDEVLRMKQGSGVNDELTSDDIKEVDLRTAYAKRWLQTAAPAQYVFKLQDTLPQGARTLSDIQRKALTATHDAFTNLPTWSGEAIHAALHSVKEQTGIAPKDFFTSFYRAFLDKESGPKLGWFLSTLDKTFVLERLAKQTGNAS